MSRLVTILRAAHCRSTHHYFAIDALEKVDTVQGTRLANLLLKYHDEYLIGAKAPDKSFRDFSNHVVHVGDNNWGGAPEACERWVRTALEQLDQRKWKKAAYSCGVLSHYFTDPLMPLHTGQCEKESALHRPMEWSVYQAYDEIYDLIQDHDSPATFSWTGEGSWIRQAVLTGANVAHQHYHRVMDLYDLQRGAKRPPEGLNMEARRIFAELFDLATSGWAKILSRLADETTAEIPEVSVSLTTILATLDMPLAWVLRKIDDVVEQRHVRKIVDELQATGTVRRHLPREVKAVARDKAKALPPSSASVPLSTHQEKSPSNERPRPRFEVLPSPAERSTAEAPPSNTIVASPSAEVPEAGSPSTASPVASRSRRPRVTVADDLVKAPSIGPKTARRFAKIGLTTIGEFLSADAASMVQQLNTRWMTVELLTDWQAQATLVCEISALWGYEAQLLVACGCRTKEDLATSNAYDLSRQIEALSQTSEGQHILRSSSLPSRDEIAAWITSAQSTSMTDAA